MNKALFASCLFFISFGTATLNADDLVQFPKGPASWTITVSSSQAPPASLPPGAAALPRVAKIEVSQDDEKRRSVITMAGGASTERWSLFKYKLLLVQEPNNHAIAVQDSGTTGSLFAIPYSDSCFEWLKSEFLVSKDPVSYQGKSCFHYMGQVSAKGGFDGTSSLSGKYEAWIDSKTLLPVAIDDTKGLAVFVFQDKAPPPLSFPAQFQKLMTRLNGP